MTISDEYTREVEKAMAHMSTEMQKSIAPTALYSSVTVPEYPTPPPPSRGLRLYRALGAILSAIGCLLERLLTKSCPECSGIGYDDGGPGPWTCRHCQGSGRV